MLIADNSMAAWVANRGEDGTRVEIIGEGVSMLTAHDLNDHAGSPRIARYLDRFRATPAPDPATDDWDTWAMLLGSRDFAPEAGLGGAMTVVSDTGFGTTSSALVALPAPGEGRPVFKFAPGRPDTTPFEALDV
jgi:hypothetical protein